MCGRFSLTLNPEDLISYFSLQHCPVLAPRYNIAPSQMVPIIRAADENRRISLARWGLVPGWADNETIGNRMINARIETAAQKPSFRQPFRRRRCLIPASGFYEWQKKGSAKQPFFIHYQDRSPMAFGGLWERWASPDDSVCIESCTILTTEARGEPARLHDRMPVILPYRNFASWLSPHLLDPAEILALAGAPPESDLALEAVSSYVNRSTNEGPQCQSPPETLG